MTLSINPPEPISSTATEANSFSPENAFNQQLRLKHILKTLPKQCFQKDMRQAWTALAMNVFMVGLGYWALAIAPWYLLPVLWVFQGTALTGFFVLAHDCGHRSFAKRRWVNDFVGHILILPLIYPFHGWRIMHNLHHKYTNKMDVDNAWQPPRPEAYDRFNSVVQWFYRRLRGRFWWLSSIIHWAGLHFDWRQFQGKAREQVKFSALLVIGFAAIAFPLLFLTTGFWGIVKFWFMPWMVYHFWMSTFTLVHHTAPDIAFQEPDQWHEAMAQLAGTVHCEYPFWVEWLCHHINVHVPHHLSTAIPSYRLRMAHESLRENWGSYLSETEFSWQLMCEITDHCHLYDADRSYQSFKEYHSR
ncbi:fatty acid desaturase [Leptolyngbya ohadii]|uniref:fatty acid desaturase n=1 Tax=Leptolyngbya ohadii TaxID=1962290 RepID=UPI000B5A127A|nr:fatty acid desaturase [Leptolyngbya ohadii]